ncbi:MAG: bifunctional phosphopantothenoylcysteine decarboxylase/phosphopantothenate--cysteine ligase CoaBC [Calditrichaeota bacterium]|nr:MAG: bifunctional phosphopantothenoylcysteine decarboxylase/phosphopantothenate--cysteine ligase CoaBC [Calditrichota bacterium]
MFTNRRILVGITGCIAAYKSCELIRYLKTRGATVRVMMTASAEQFITRLTLETLSREPVAVEMFPGHFAATHHIELADWAEAAIIAPATANILAKAARGLADDLVSTVLLALHCPVVFAPAMNSHMWENPAVQENVALLRERGYLICEPEEGFLAEGYSGVGRLARPEHLVQYLYRAAHPASRSLEGKTVLITAGATREFVDPVRMLTNRSTGKMGFALAWEAFARGARVILIHGPTELTPPAEVEAHAVVSAEEMYAAVEQRFPEADIFISAAAVADYRPVERAAHKLKKGKQPLALTLERTPDILQAMSRQRKAHQRLVGFAVETDSPRENALKKLENKNLDVVVLNNPLESGAGFATDTNRVTLFSRTEERQLKTMYKLDVAREIFNFLLSDQPK